MSQVRQRRLKGRYLIRDRSGLASLLRASVEKQFAGNQRAAARELAALGCTQRELSRLARGEIGAITDRTVGWVTELVEEPQQAQLWHFLFPPMARARLAIQRSWAERASERLPKTERLEFELRRRFPTEFGAFDRFLESHEHVQVVRGKKTTLRQRMPRADLAFRLVLDPLRWRQFTAGIERGLEEFSERELRSYLRYAFAAQQLLLSRPPDVDRALSA